MTYIKLSQNTFDIGLLIELCGDALFLPLWLTYPTRTYLGIKYRTYRVDSTIASENCKTS
jgi:hypothetical protein